MYFLFYTKSEIKNATFLDSPMNTREQKGLEIAARMRVVFENGI